MRRGSTLRFFVLAVLFSTLVFLGPCEGFNGGTGNWDTRRGMVSIDRDLNKQFVSMAGTMENVIKPL